jgi:hypothetical protein
MHESGWVPAVLCKAARHVAAEGGHVGTQERFSPRAVETGEAGLHGVCDDAGAEGEMGDVGAKGDDGAGCFVA